VTTRPEFRRCAPPSIRWRRSTSSACWTTFGRSGRADKLPMGDAPAP